MPMNTQTSKERLVMFIEHLCIPVSRFEREVGLSHGYMNQLRHCPSARVLNSIESRFPEFNKDWVVTGAGNMLNTDDNTITITQNSNNSGNTNIGNNDQTEAINILKSQVEYLKQQLQEKDEQISKLINLAAQS